MIKQLADVSLKSLDMINKNADGILKLAEFLKNFLHHFRCSKCFYQGKLCKSSNTT